MGHLPVGEVGLWGNGEFTQDSFLALFVIRDGIWPLPNMTLLFFKNFTLGVIIFF